MRIDNENKVVLPIFVADYIEKYYDNRVPTDDRVPNSWDKADFLRDWDNYISVSNRSDVREWLENADNFLKFVIAIATDDYMIEQPKKYYWRKKKEHLAWFEGNKVYVSMLSFANEPTLAILEYADTFTENEARDLLKDDFDKFEKVECE